jgi:hypothetical protein
VVCLSGLNSRTRVSVTDASRLEMVGWYAEDAFVCAARLCKSAHLAGIYLSYGFRPKRGQHGALDALAVGITDKKGAFIFDADVRSFFGEVSQSWLIRFVEHRIGDPRIIRLIQKWLKAGVLEDGVVTVSEKGTGAGFGKLHGCLPEVNPTKVAETSRFEFRGAPPFQVAFVLPGRLRPPCPARRFSVAAGIRHGFRHQLPRRPARHSRPASWPPRRSKRIREIGSSPFRPASLRRAPGACAPARRASIRGAPRPLELFAVGAQSLDLRGVHRAFDIELCPAGIDPTMRFSETPSSATAIRLSLRP